MSDFAEKFVHHLQAIAQRDRAALAALRHSLAFAPGSYPPAYPHVERFVAAGKSASDASRLALYVTAGLFAQHPLQGERTLAASLGVLMRQRDSASIENRFVALLGADAANLPDYLRQIVSLLAADGLALDYATLLDDLSFWLNPYLDPERRDRIRQRWARDFYRALENHNASENNESTI